MACPGVAFRRGLWHLNHVLGLNLQIRIGVRSAFGTTQARCRYTECSVGAPPF